MRNNVLLGAGILVLMIANPAWAQPTGFDNHQVVKIQVADQTQLEVLKALDAASNDFEIWSEGLGVGIIEARVSPDQKRRLDASGLKYTVHIEDLQTHIDEMYADRVPGGFFDQYRTYDEHVTFLNDLVAQYPTLAQTIDLGLSVDGRTLLAIRITGPGASKVGVIYHGAQHGNEQAGAMLVAYTANHLLTHYATDPEVQTLVDNAEWFLLPIMNPDGYEAYSRCNANGVDLNRNWGGPGCGYHPFSEPETAALRDFLLAHRNVRLHLDVHGYVPWFMWPWGHKPEYTPDHSVYHSVGVEVRDLIDAAGGAYYEIGSGYEVSYSVSGGSMDYSYGNLNLWGYTFELTHSTIPDIYDHFLSTLLFLASWVSDCNNNGIPDFEETLAGSIPDCNDNGIPDECDIDYGTAPDCNTNAVPDECDIADGTSEDCNLNEVPDECDLVGGTGFAAVRRYTAGEGSRSVAIGDLDNDGDDDLAVANYYGDDVSVLANHGDGTFVAAVPYSTGFLPSSVAIGDLDNDGDADLAVANRYTSDVSVLLNNGDGTFAASVSYPAGNGPLFVAIGDLDNDGDDDLVVANGSDGNLSVLMNNGNGTFAAAVSYAAGEYPYSVAIGDLDNDGDDDLAVANNSGNEVSVLLNNSDGTFAAAVSYATGEWPHSVAIGDLNNDGDADLAVANNHSGDASVLLNNGDGTFAAAVSYAAGEDPYSVAIGDLDNDGDADLAVANGASDDVSVLLNNDDGTFAEAGRYAVGSAPLSVAIADLDHDDDNDLAIANCASGDVTVLLNNVAAYSLDCNINDVPDECDIADGTSDDCNENGVPDECDIADGTSEDANDNGIPDECESPPVAICQDVAVGADTSCEGHVAAEDVDGGSYDPDGGPVDLSLEPPGPFPLGVTIVILTVSDDLGQTDTCMATITVVDTTAPGITCPPDVIVECDQSTDPSDTGMATAPDNCDPSPAVGYSDEVTPGACPQEYVITRTWTATDASGNSSSCEQVITVEDTTPPSIDIPASNLTVECDGAGNVVELDTWLDSHGGAVASDVCGGVAWSDDFAGLSDDCGATGSATVTFTATDDCGLLSTTTATFTIEDTTPPAITCPTDVTVTCGEPTDPDGAGWATATDICDDDPVYPAIIYSDVETPTSCLADLIMYTIARTWTATDGCGNSSECVQTITVMKVALDLDIKPGSCPNSYNRNSHGVLPIGLLGTIGFDVTVVDLTSVRLSRADCVGGSVAPHEGPPGPHSVYSDVGTPFEGEWCDCHELEGDGFIDLSMKLKTDDVVPTLELDSLSPGALVELVVTGALADGCEFIASDCVRLVPPGTAAGQLYVESNVPGAWIDASPLDETLDGGGFAHFERVYPLTTVVTLTAEMSSHGQSFVAWQIDGIVQEPGENTVQFVMDGSMTAKALYRAPVFWLPRQMGTETPLPGTEAP